MSADAATTDTTLRLTRVLHAPPERVFAAWATAEALKQWHAPGDMTVPSARVDFRVGGRYEVTMRASDGKEHRVAGVYREITPPRRVVYTWQWQREPATPETVVTVEFHAHTEGTELALIHVLPAEAGTQHEQGWNGCLAKLERLFA